MLVNFVSHLVSLDVVWLYSFIANNLLLFFMLFAGVHIVSAGKNVVWNFLTVMFLFWIELDFLMLAGWVFYTASILMFVYISRVALLVFAETFPQLENKMVIIVALHGISMLILFNVILK